MSSVFSFQAQLVSIMDALSKTAIVEISKLVEIESKMLKIEITRGRNEIASLTEKLQLMEKLLYMAQGRNQDVAAAASSVVRESQENKEFLVPEITKLVIKSALHPSEALWESTTSCSERSSLHQSEEHAAAEEQPELVVVKAEPPELDSGNTEQDITSEYRKEAVTDTQKSPDVMQHSKPITDNQQPLFTNRVATLSPQQSLGEPERGEMNWNPQLILAHTTLQVGKCMAQNVASQSGNVLRKMKPHNFRNSAAKRVGCLQCGKSFRCFSQLEIHQRSHTGEKPFRCMLCGKRYAQKGHLYTHQRTHTGEKPYRCPICGKGFIQKCTLDMHQRTHTGEKPFVCVNCGKGFTKKCNLKKHLAVHVDSNVSRESAAPSFGGMFTNETT
uniref:Zinc finger protein 793 n=2 Tax=Nothobranchius TaxID=28779 RepID=A0A1A8IZZ4_NOTKU